MLVSSEPMLSRSSVGRESRAATSPTVGRMTLFPMTMADQDQMARKASTAARDRTR